MASSLFQQIEQEFGVRTRSAENREDVTIDTTSTIVLRADGGRLAFTIINLGSNAVFIRPNNAATATLGIRIAPGGGSVSMNFKDDFSLVGKEFHAITSSSTSTIYTNEEIIAA